MDAYKSKLNKVKHGLEKDWSACELPLNSGLPVSLGESYLIK